MIQKYLFIHLLLLGLLLLGAFLFNANGHILSLSCGALLTGLNVIFLMWVGQRLFLKKNIALGVFFIVTKYTFWGVAIYLLSQQENISLWSVFIGTLVFLPSLVIFWFRHSGQGME